MNQKGFIVIPVIVWWVLGFVVLTGTVAVKEGLIPVDLSEKIIHDGSRTGARVGYQSYCNPEQGVVIYENEKMPFVTDEGENVLWTKGDIDCYKERKLAEKNIQAPIPTPLPPIQPKPTQKPVVQQGIQTNQNNQTTQGRTGRIVKYKEYCKGGKEISVYESELITKKAADGNTYSMTKDDWDCYERNLKQNQQLGNGNIPPYQPTTPSTPSEPLVDCVLDYGMATYTHRYTTQSQCNLAKTHTAEFNKCIAEKNTKLDTCRDPVNKKSEEEKSICLWAWGVGGFLGGDYGNSTKLTECFDEVSEDRKKAMDDCHDTHDKETDTCIRYP